MNIPPTCIALLVSATAFPGTARATIVLDLIGNVNAYTVGASDPMPSQIFTDFPAFSCAVLEDFSVSAAELIVSSVSVVFLAQGGFEQFQNIERFALNIYTAPARAGESLTGDVASQWFAASAITRVVDPSGEGEFGRVDLSVNLTLPAAGTYWVGVSPQSAMAVTGQFLVANANLAPDTPPDPTGPGLANAMLANPGQGFGIGALSSLDADYAYSVTVVPEPSTLALCLLGSAGLLRHRRPPAPPIINHKS